MTAPRHQTLPSSGEKREALRSKGQFWTPDWLAEAMVAYGLANGAETVFDPAVGSGAFFRAAKKVGADVSQRVALLGSELHPEILSDAIDAGLERSDLVNVETRDFVLDPPNGGLEFIVANPPYLRHHRIPLETKARLREFSIALIRSALDGRAGFHVFFLLRALTLLRQGGRLAFVLPSDTAEGVFAKKLWEWIAKHFHLEAVVTFPPDATPFPGVDTNAMVFFIRRAEPQPTFFWVSCTSRDAALKNWVMSRFAARPGQSLIVERTSLVAGVCRGLSRRPVFEDEGGATLIEFATVVRGIATGANDFFHLTRLEAEKWGIPGRWLLPAIGRTRDASGDRITQTMLEELDAAGRATQLLALDGTPLEKLPASVREYIRHGESLGLSQRSLIGTRSPWYKMEVRKVPPFLFAYLGRRSSRFIRNEAGVVPLTGFLCVYPKDTRSKSVAKLWEALNDPATISGLAKVGKSYGGGAVKVEPRGLERLPIPKEVIERAGLELPEIQLSCLAETGLS